MLPRSTNDYGHPAWQPPTQRQPTSSTAPISAFSPTLPDSSRALNGYEQAYSEPHYPVLHSTELSQRPTGGNNYSPGPPPPPLDSSIESYSSIQGRPNGVTMFPPSELDPLPESRAQWSAHDRRKSSKIEAPRGTGEGSSEGHGWNHGVGSSARERRSSWASPSFPSFGQPQHHFAPPPLATDGSGYLSPLSTSNPNSSSSNHAPSRSSLQHEVGSYAPQQFQPSFLSSSTNSSTSNYPHPYSFQPPPPINSSRDSSLPFRDFTAPSHSLHQAPSSFSSASFSQSHPHYLGNPLVSSHLPAPPASLGTYVPSQTLRAPPSPRVPAMRRRSSVTIPPNPSCPYIASTDPSKPCAAVLKAAAHRERLGVLDVTGRLGPADKQVRRTVIQQSTRRAVELEFNCAQCGGGIGKLTLRGGAVEYEGGDEPSNYVGRFVCSTCLPLPSAVGIGKEKELAFTGYNDEAIYDDTLSGAVDRFQGLDLAQTDVRPTPAPPGKSRTGFIPNQGTSGKKRRASVLDSTEGLLGCDVCRREIGSGELACATGEAVNASIEVLCAFCDSRYLRCSDCGGGGGTKGVGRWRSKEMFPHGRRTCQLVHTRMGAVNDMDYDVWPISQLSESERDRVSTMCAELHASTILSTLAVPDMIESVSAIARSFEEVEKICIDCWTTYDPLIRYDIEASSPAKTKRYIALRWSTPMVRKKKSRAKNPTLNADGTPSRRGGSRAKERDSPSLSPDAQSQGPVLFREGKTLTGFIIAEHDLEDGILHVALTVPTGAGEAYEATTRLLQTLIARAHDDLAATNADRALRNLPEYPPLTQAWTMHMTKRDSRIMSRVETRRGFIPLEDYLATHPESRRECFAPQRECYLPPELLRGWLVYAKEITEEDFPPDYSPPPSQQPSRYSQHPNHNHDHNGHYASSSHYQ